jgi:glycosyltransferase involved in cell wall biosynthesis
MPALMRSADLAVSVPWYEPFGMVPLEAMACGVPVVASAVGGHTDTVVDGVTGVLVPPRQPDVLIRVIRDLLASGKLPGFGSAAAERARTRYSWERISQETIAVYERIRRGRGAAASQPSRAPQHSGAGQ